MKKHNLVPLVVMREPFYLTKLCNSQIKKANDEVAEPPGQSSENVRAARHRLLR